MNRTRPRPWRLALVALAVGAAPLVGYDSAASAVAPPATAHPAGSPAAVSPEPDGRYILHADDGTQAGSGESGRIEPGWVAIVEGLDANAVALRLDGAEHARLALRSRGPEGWSESVELHGDSDEAPDDEGSVPPMAGPVWTGAATTAVEVTVLEGSGSSLTLLPLSTLEERPSSSVRLASIVSSAAAPSAPSASSATAARPQILPPEAWGSPGWRYTNADCGSGPEQAPLQLGVVHHTASTNTYTAAEVPAVLRSIWQTHVVANGWCDIAYNFIVDRFGRIWQARSGPANAPIIGGHARGFNTGSVGVALLGQHQTGASPAAASPTSAAMASVAEVLAWKFSLHGLDPRSSTTYVVRADNGRYRAGDRVTVPRILGHGDTGSSSCPGNLVTPQLAAMRTSVAGRLVHPVRFAYGSATDVPLWGDWDGDGIDEPAIRRGNEYHLKHTIGGGAADVTVVFGRHTDQVLVGDWDGDGVDTIGVYRDGEVYLARTNTRNPAVLTSYRYGRPGDEGVAGDWDGDGRSSVGIRRGNEWHLRNRLTSGGADVTVVFGRHTDDVLVGDWDGDGVDTPGVRREASVFLLSRLRTNGPVAQQQVPSGRRAIVAGDPTGRGFDLVGGVISNEWTSWYQLERVQ